MQVPKKTTLSAQLLPFLFPLTDGRCHYCGRILSGQTTDTVLDHVVPVSKGGPTSPDNIVVACKSCNSRKCGRTIEEVRVILAHGRAKLNEQQITHLQELGVDLDPYFQKIAATRFHFEGEL